MAKPPKRPRDMMQLAKFIGEIAAGERDESDSSVPSPTQERASKGGKARAAKLPAKKRSAIARKGGLARRKDR